MSLKFKCRSKDEIPQDLANHYVERDGAWLLDVEGAVDRSKLDEFRATNLALLKERDDLQQRFQGIDPDEVRKLADEKRKLEELQHLKAGDIDKVFDARVQALKAGFDKQLSGVTSERDALHARLSGIQIDQAVVAEATKRGLRLSAIPDITSRARTTFRLVNGVPQALEADGQSVRPGRDGCSPLTLAEWVDGLLGEAPHLFESNAGGGAAGVGPGGAGNRSVRNPFRKESWNVTEQMKVTKTDPALAARLAASA
jgi:hypothetical protein